MKITKELTLPPETASRTVGVIAQKGAGKTYTGMKIAEEMLVEKTQIVCLDPTGVWWGLKADGTGKGFPILVMGGSHGDIPLAHTSGEVVADFIVNSGQSVVLDLSSFNSNAEQNRFVTDFAERLYRAKAEARTSLHLFLDEADSFAPQRPMPGEQRMLGALEAIVRRGRSRGLGMTMISQRPAVLNKNVLTQCDLLIALRVVGIQDHKALAEWTSINGTEAQRKSFLTDLPSLPTGTAFFWSPSWLNIFEKGEVLKRRTFDSSQTPVPGKVTAAPKLAAVDIAALSAEILATVETSKANDPKALRAEIAKLEAKLSAGHASRDEIEAARKEGFEECRQRVRAFQVGLLADVQGISEKLSDVLREDGRGPVMELANAQPRPRAPLPPMAGNPPARKPAASEPSSVLNSAQVRVLTSLFWLRNEEITPVKVAFFANYTVNGHFNNTMGSLRKLGLVEGWKITPAGEAAVPSDVQDKPTGRELREWIREKIGSAENKILDVLIRYLGKRVEVSALAEQAGYTVNGHFNNSLGKLRTLQIAEGGARDGGVKASEVFFQ